MIYTTVIVHCLPLWIISNIPFDAHPHHCQCPLFCQSVCFGWPYLYKAYLQSWPPKGSESTNYWTLAMAQDGVKTLFYWQISKSARQWIRTIVYIITAAPYVLNDWTVVLNMEQELHIWSMQKSLLQIHLFSSTPHCNNIFGHQNNTVIYSHVYSCDEK